jgi:hypothetical protein
MEECTDTLSSQDVQRLLLLASIQRKSSGAVCTVLQVANMYNTAIPIEDQVVFP